MQTPTANSLLQAWELGQLLSPTRELAALPLGARDPHAWLCLREALFGDGVAGVALCPHCSAPSSLVQGAGP